MIDILYEDNDLIVCIKPVGVLSQSGPEGGEDMLTILKAYMEEKSGTQAVSMPETVLERKKGTGGKHRGNVTVGLIHRLDRNVGGVMVFSKNAGVTSKLSQAIREREFQKEYYAVVHNCPKEKTGIYKDYLFKDSSKNKTFVVSRPRKGVKEASLEYEVLGTQASQDGVISLVRIRLHTGRTHQIRVQFASRRMPLLGDGKYGGRDNGCDIALWSYRLAFWHPVKGTVLEFTKEPEDGYPWNLFDKKES